MSEQLPRKRIIGYADRLSARPGERVSFMVSCEDVPEYEAAIVRLRSADLHPAGRGWLQSVVDTPVTGRYRGRRQDIDAGSYVLVESGDSLSALESFTPQAWSWPTRPGRGEQVVLGCWSTAEGRGFALCLDAQGALSLVLGGAGGVRRVSTGRALPGREWALVSAGYCGKRKEARLWQRIERGYPAEDDDVLVHEESVATGFDASALPFTLAAGVAARGAGRVRTAAHFNGKIEAPRVFSRALAGDEIPYFQSSPIGTNGLVAAWDFALDTRSDHVRGIGPRHLDGRVVNLPARAMKGHAWSGETYDWKGAPAEYGAIHFHDDDIYDCGWQADFSLVLPEGLRSGVYAARLRSGDDEDHIPFVVRPKAGEASAPALVLLPTASYLAYANEHSGSEGGGPQQAMMNHLTALSAHDLLLAERPELGYSLYDVHSDGSGVCYSSRLRPILNFRPGVTCSWVGAAGTFPWQFNADLPLIDWLDECGIAYDVATDEDLHAEGLALLERYRVVMSGSHPEYTSRAMYDGLRAYLRHGGRLMYLGGNGFYWRIAYHPTLPGVIELRPAEDGIRDWTADGGEYYLSFTGEYGGMWERMGRPIQALVGVGMSGQGFDVCTYYRRTAASRDPRAAFMFEGVEDEVIGDFGTAGGGAVGIEVDRFDVAKGSPPHALVVARSEGLSDTYYPGPEEINNASPLLDASQNEKVRADMVFFETPRGGAVFSVGSIAWLGSLSFAGFDNNVARITGNVLRRFLDPAPFRSS